MSSAPLMHDESSTEADRRHWEDVYTNKATDELTWYQPRPDISLELIEEASGVAMDGPVRVIDVGGGASTLVDYLLEEGGYEPAVLDIAPAALERARERLGERADRVDWVVADVTEPLDALGAYDIWHDRAVFHFLTGPEQRAAYLSNLRDHLEPGGFAVMATFALDGPETCSGLPVQRYSAETLADEFGEAFELVESRREQHPTPWGGEQSFVYGLFRRVA